MTGSRPIKEPDRQLPTRGELVAELSRAMVGLHKDFYGKGPTKAQTFIVDDVVVCVLEGGFSEAERTLTTAGRAAAVTGQRRALQEVLRQRFVDTVERLTGREVRAFVSGVDTASEVSTEVFVLGAQAVNSVTE